MMYETGKMYFIDISDLIQNLDREIIMQMNKGLVLTVLHLFFNIFFIYFVKWK